MMRERERLEERLRLAYSPVMKAIALTLSLDHLQRTHQSSKVAREQ